MIGLSQRGNFVILTYHRVVPKPDPLWPSQVDRVFFTRQMEVLRRYFNVLPLKEACSRLRDNALPPRAVVITFDDGYADNLHIAAPILSKFGLPATFFIATGYLNGGRMWNDTIIEAIRATSISRVELDFLSTGPLTIDGLVDRRHAIETVISKIKYLPADERNRIADQLASLLQVRALPQNLMMTDDEIRALHAEGMEIGGHTVSHPILSLLTPEEARSEIVNGRDYLAERLDVEITSFAYPNGRPQKDYQASHVEVVRESRFDLAVSTAWGPVRKTDDFWQLPRVGIEEFRKIMFALRLLRSYWDPEAARV